MREFYVYGFKSRDGYNKKSLRSYDDEKRRKESKRNDYMNLSAYISVTVYKEAISVKNKKTRRN